MFFKRCSEGVHKFSARYSLRFSAGLSERITSLNSVDLAEVMKDKIYEGDVCSWCGKMVNAPKS